MLHTLFDTTSDPILTVLRLILGIVFFAHGAQKMLGWFGGSGFKATMQGFTEYLHIPTPLAFLAIATEFFGGLGLIAGLFGRLAALGVICNMIVAVMVVHRQYGFFMNWSGQQKGEGFEFHLLAIGLAIAILAYGSGAFSVDQLISKTTNQTTSRMGGAQAEQVGFSNTVPPNK